MEFFGLTNGIWSNWIFSVRMHKETGGFKPVPSYAFFLNRMPFVERFWFGKILVRKDFDGGKLKEMQKKRNKCEKSKKSEKPMGKPVKANQKKWKKWKLTKKWKKKKKMWKNGKGRFSMENSSKIAFISNICAQSVLPSRKNMNNNFKTFQNLCKLRTKRCFHAFYDVCVQIVR